MATARRDDSAERNSRMNARAARQNGDGKMVIALAIVGSVAPLLTVLGVVGFLAVV